ncbi:MAG: hypothetical protein AAB373_02445 [Patescibacteria group bacterium]
MPKESQRDLVPLPDVESKILKLDLPVQYVDPRQIGVRVQDIESMCKFAGIDAFEFSLSNDPAIENGKVEVGRYSNGAPTKTTKRYDYKCRVNRDEINKVASAKGIHSPESWADVLDQKLKKILKLVQKESLKDKTPRDFIYNMSDIGLLALPTLHTIWQSQNIDLSDSLSQGAILAASYKVLLNLVAHLINKDSRIQFLNIDGVEVDRLIINEVIHLCRSMMGKRLIEVIK